LLSACEGMAALRSADGQQWCVGQSLESAKSAKGTQQDDIALVPSWSASWAAWQLGESVLQLAGRMRALLPGQDSGRLTRFKRFTHCCVSEAGVMVNLRFLLQP
jgi:hypothetical protein